MSPGPSLQNEKKKLLPGPKLRWDEEISNIERQQNSWQEKLKIWENKNDFSKRSNDANLNEKFSYDGTKKLQ